MIDYEVGQIPSSGLPITVRDDVDNPISTIGYTATPELLGSNNERVDMTGVVIETMDAAPGTYILNFPKDRSLFKKKGVYMLRLRLTKSDGSVDYTRAREIRVREFGRLMN